MTEAELMSLPRRALRDLLRGGHPVRARELADFDYHGTALGLPRWVEKLSWQTFTKVFCADGDRVRGWNVRVEQDGVDGPHAPLLTRAGAPRTFGHFEAVPGGDHGATGPLAGHLMLHYGRGGNAALDPAGLLRDPVVALSPGDAAWLLGWTYLDLGAAVPTPSYFSLRRGPPRSHTASPPRPRRP